MLQPRNTLPGQRALVLILLATLLASAACRSTTQNPRWNVMLVVVDALRADHLSLYGYDRPTSPFLEELAQEAVVFDNSWSQAACTFPSVNSLLTSRYPHVFVEQAAGNMGVPARIPVLPEILQRHGYATAAVSASPIVRQTPSSHNPGGGFGRGFGTFDESCLNGSARCVNRRAFDLLDQLTEPFFLYLHYMEPHALYRPPRKHRRLFARPYRDKDWVRQGDIRPLKKMLYDGEVPLDFSERDVRHLRALYDEEILYFDRQFRILVRRLARNGLLDRTLLVLVSDHGEELLDHFHAGHCRDLTYQTLVSTPIILRVPSLARGGHRQGKAQNIDLVPTLLDYLGVPHDNLGLEGTSLRAALESDRETNRYLFAAQGTSRAVSDGDYKFIHDIASQEEQLYRLLVDPKETVDLLSSLPEEADRLRQVLFEWIESQEGSVGSADSVRRAHEREKQLKALGYL